MTRKIMFEPSSLPHRLTKTAERLGRLALALAVLGTLTTMASAQLVHRFTIGVPSSFTSYGAVVDSIGDLDGDGSRDLILGTHNYSFFSTTHGHVEVLSGTHGGLIHGITSPILNDGFGCSVAAVGDVDFDSVPDFVVGAYRSGIGGIDSGRVDVFSGASGALILSIIGPSPGGLFGWSVAHLPDVNYDGVTDLAVAAPGMGAGGTIYVFSGQTGATLQIINGTAAQPLNSIIRRVGDCDGDGLDDIVVGSTSASTTNGVSTGFIQVYSTSNGGLLYQVNGQDFDGSFGASIRRAGDIDNDGVEDLIVSASLAHRSPTITRAGRVFVLSGADGSTIHDFRGTHVNEGAGGTVHSVSDITGDGVPDFFVSRAGSFYGGTSGTYCISVHSGKTGAALGYLTDSTGAIVDGAMRMIGDLDGDGLEDLYIIDLLASSSGPHSCSVYLTKALNLPAIGGGQANTSDADLRVNEIATGSVSGPFTSTLLRGLDFSIEIQGAPYALYELYGSPTLNPGGWLFPGFGSLDIGTGPAFADVTALFPGFSSAFPLYALDASGAARHVFYIPPTWPQGSIGAIQALVQKPQPFVGGIWGALSAAHELVLQ